jgi:hypothetical protein
MRLGVLGPLAVWTDQGEPVPIPGRVSSMTPVQRYERRLDELAHFSAPLYLSG